MNVLKNLFQNKRIIKTKKEYNKLWHIKWM